MATYFRTDGWVKTVLGQALAGAQVYVCLQPATTTSAPPSPLANIFSDPNGLLPITQPVSTDGFGHYDYYVLPGTYTVVIVDGGLVQQVYPDQSVAAGSGGNSLIAGIGINITGNIISAALLGGTGITITNNVISTNLVAGSGISIVGNVISATGGGGGGTVTSFSSGSLSPLFTASVANPTTAPALSFTLNTQTANTIFGGPVSGGATTPTFRPMVVADVPAGLTSIPTSGGVTAPSPLWSGTTASIQSIAAATTLNLTLSAVANSSGNVAVYTGTITGGAANAFAGLLFVVAGFTTSTNNGEFTCTASSGTTLTLNNEEAVSESHAATANLLYAVTPVIISSTTQFANNAVQGSVFVIAGASSGANNGTFLVSLSSSTLLYVDNANGVLQAGAAGTAELTEAFTGTGITPEVYSQDVSGFWHGQFGIDTTTVAGPPNGPPVPQGTLTCGRRVFFRDNMLTTQNGKNAFISVNHTSGRGTSQQNQDRAIWVQMQNDQFSSDTIYGMEGIQVEVDCVGTPVFQNAVDGEVAAVSAQMSDQHTNVASAPSYGCVAGRFQYYREVGSAMWGSVSPGAMRLISTNFSTVNAGGMTIVGLDVTVTDGSASPSNVNGTAISVTAPAGRLTSNRGIFIGNFGTNAADFAIESLGGQCLFTGPIGLGSIFPGSNTTGGLVVASSGLSCEGLTVVTLTKPLVVTATPVGVTGATTYTYVIVAKDPNGGAIASNSSSTTTGNATLNGSNFNQLETASPPVGPSTYDIYRTVGGATQGKIATVTPSPDNYTQYSSIVINDTGLVGDSTSPPSGNTSGTIVAQGPISSGQYTVSTLPTGKEGQTAYATNGRKVGEGAGSGTGVPVYFSNTQWRVYSTDAQVTS